MPSQRLCSERGTNKQDARFMQSHRQPLRVSTARIRGPVSRTFAHNPVSGKIILEDNRVHQKHSAGTFRFGEQSPQRSLPSLCFKGAGDARCPMSGVPNRSAAEAGELQLLLPAAPGPFLPALFSEQTRGGDETTLLSLAGNSV